MNPLIAIVGPSGVGKTTLFQALVATGRFIPGVEQHAERPFQKRFDQDKHYALANQVDYLLFRAAQEKQLRAESKPALVDGGLDMDFQGFTRLFHARGWLAQDEFDLCEQLYLFTRSLLPPPDLVVALSAPAEAIHLRLAARQRINIASAKDAGMLASFIEQWLGTLPAGQVLRLETGNEPRDYSRSVNQVLERIGGS